MSEQIEKLKYLEAMTQHMRSAPPEMFQPTWCRDTAELLSAFTQLAPELIALWEAAEALYSLTPEDGLDKFDLAESREEKALLDLNAKAKEVLGSST